MGLSVTEEAIRDERLTINMILLVNRSEPERTIITKPTGNMSAPMVLMSPGAFS